MVQPSGELLVTLGRNWGLRGVLSLYSKTSHTHRAVWSMGFYMAEGIMRFAPGPVWIYLMAPGEEITD
ncbi:MAG TPA: hypothetical protein VGL40_00820 [Bacillota bacterium]